MIKTYTFSEMKSGDIFSRVEEENRVAAVVADIIKDVRANGDEALIRYAEKFDKATLTSLEVTEAEIEEAVASVEPEFLRILADAAKNIRAFHENQKRDGFRLTGEGGVVMGQKVTPIEKVGLYVPGGTAAYPSTVLMDSIPAKIAGCREIVMVTPPGRDGKVNPVILAAAKIAGVTRIFKCGGAQAVAALAYGTESVPRVYKIVGPGNAYVAEAKRQVYGQVSIDMIAGPSEILILADGTGDPVCVAADMLSQAEHDRMASAVLVTTSVDFAEAVKAELNRQIPLLPRREIAEASIDNYGKIILAETMEEAIEASNEIAPEHLELYMDDPFAYLDKIENAGSIFMGKNCPEALGDYMAGPNHTLPTSGTAKFSSPLSVDDFVKKTQYTYFTEEALGGLYRDVAFFAEKEGLSAHARSAESRFHRPE
ncbi:MAG: histidinol dehydrogenase [Clostridia bacterium]|nr:histidinol dehydrogenase [Clostridia bacterium]